MRGTTFALAVLWGAGAFWFVDRWTHSLWTTNAPSRAVAERRDANASATRFRAAFAKHTECLFHAVNNITASRVFYEFARVHQNCRNRTPELEEFNYSSFENNKEFKFVRLAQTDQKKWSECRVVTLGVGTEVDAELGIRRHFPTCDFVGADPIVDGNRKIFEAFGRFFGVAVGHRSGRYSASVFKYNGVEGYKDVEFEHVEFVTFLQNSVGVDHVVDILIMDNEYPEYDLAPYFFAGGQLDKANIVVCQVNIEFHVPRRSQKRELQLKFTNIILQLLFEHRYAILEVSRATHNRLYLFNYVEQECVERYLISEAAIHSSNILNLCAVAVFLLLFFVI